MIRLPIIPGHPVFISDCGAILRSRRATQLNEKWGVKLPPVGGYCFGYRRADARVVVA
jgi:hypothetical protein